MADCRLPAQPNTAEDFPGGAFYHPGISIHSCVKALNVAVPATKLFYAEREERTYAYLSSDEDGEWKEEIVVNVMDLADAETQPGKQPGFNRHTKNTDTSHTQTTNRLVSEPRLGPVQYSDMGLSSATSEPEFKGDHSEEAERHDSVLRYATDTKPEDVSCTKDRSTRSEGQVKAGERPQGRGRILEFGRSIANVLTRPFRRQSRRRDERAKTEKCQTPERTTAAPTPEDTTKMEESRLPAEELITKQFHSKEAAKQTTGRGAPTAQILQPAT